jgi:hypothetical protein
MMHMDSPVNRGLWRGFAKNAAPHAKNAWHAKRHISRNFRAAATLLPWNMVAAPHFRW